MSRPARPAPGGHVDWTVAGAVGTRLTRPGPPTTDYTRRQVVDDLAAASRRAEGPVREVTGLSVSGPAPDARIVDRREWVVAAADSLRVMAGGAPARGGGLIAARLAGAQTGAVLAFVSSGILGQFDPFAGDRGELLLVYPNVIAAERQLRVPPQDFRLWVCLHEVTHRYQFGHAPWLADHLRSLIRRIVGAESAPLSGWRPGKPLPRTLVDLVLGPDGREAFDEAGAVMALMEGHADFMMDRTDAVPGVAAIRAKFQARREAGGLDAVIRAVTGLDAKHAQYRDGAAFCRRVVSAVGVAGLNRAFESAALLPTRSEIADPDLWVARTRRSS